MMKNFDLAFVISLLNKVSSRFDDNLSGDAELYADCGLDSREFIHIIREIEIALKLNIDDEDLLEAQLVTIDDLVAFINKIYNKNKTGSTHEHE